MRKRGFTLAEVLITLGIIGIVAALTAPALMNNSGQAKIGPTLSKFVNTFETTTQQMMQDEEVTKLSAIDSFSEGSGNYLKGFPKYVKVDIVNGSELWGENYQYCLKKQVDICGGGTGISHFYTMSDGSFFFEVYNKSHKKITSTDTSNKGFLPDDIVIDINGLKKPNKIGQDVFRFVVDESGSLIPYGSRIHKSVDGLNIECDVNATKMENAFACTGAIAENNWKADY